MVDNIRITQALGYQAGLLYFFHLFNGDKPKFPGNQYATDWANLANTQDGRTSEVKTENKLTRLAEQRDAWQKGFDLAIRETMEEHGAFMVLQLVNKVAHESPM